MSELEQQQKRSRPRERVCVVLSDKMQKTIVVRWERSVRHAQYGRVVRQVTSFKVHDERNEARIGDQVLVVETRPLSKDKRWRLAKVVLRGAAQDAPVGESVEAVS